MPRLFVVFVAFRTAGSPRVGRYLRALQRRYRPDALVVVDNAGEAVRWRQAGWTAVAGDNRLREFSAWDDGVAWLEQTVWPTADDGILFVNDSVCRQVHLRWLTLGRARRAVRRLIRPGDGPRPAIAGPVLPCPMGTVRGLGAPFDRFTATCFFALRYGTYRELGGLGAELAWDELLGARWPQPLFRVPGDADYNRFYNAWLGCDAQDGVGPWPGSAGHPFSSRHYGFLREKARCILLESRLAAALAARPGFEMEDIQLPAPWRVTIERAFRLLERVASWSRRIAGAGHP